MKMNKNKVIISVLSVALIGTSAVAGVKVNHMKNDSKGAKASMVSLEKENVKKEDTEQKEKSTTEKATQSEKTTQAKKSVKSKKEIQKAEVKTTTAKIKSRTVQINKSMTDEHMHTLTFTNAKINTDCIQIKMLIHSGTDVEYGSGNLFKLDVRDIVFVANTGEKLYVPKNKYTPCNRTCEANGHGDKNINDAKTWIILNYNPSITSITATYTFDDGTTKSVKINL